MSIKKNTNGADRQFVLDLTLNKYGTEPEYPWMSQPEYVVLRHKGNKKWYAIIMYVDKSRLGLDGVGKINIVNLKCNPSADAMIFEVKGIIPAYHMNKKNWITVLLDGSVDKDMAESLIEVSYNNTKTNTKKKESYGQRSWIVPANPKYYDIEKAFAESEEILWKQSSKVCVGDIVYMYVASPYSAIKYKCIATEVDIPYQYTDENLSMSKVMKVKLLQKYDKEKIGLDRLQSHGVYSVRGPRNMPYGLEYEIENLYNDDKR